MNSSKKVCLASAALVALIAFSGLATAEEMVNVYSSRHYGNDDALFEGFTEKTGIKVNRVEARAPPCWNA